MAVKPAPAVGSKSARRTSSCLSGGRVLSVMMPASIREAPKPSIFWNLTAALISNVAPGPGLPSRNCTSGLAVSRSPAADETYTFAVCAALGHVATPRHAPINQHVRKRFAMYLSHRLRVSATHTGTYGSNGNAGRNIKSDCVLAVAAGKLSVRPALGSSGGASRTLGFGFRRSQVSAAWPHGALRKKGGQWRAREHLRPRLAEDRAQQLDPGGVRKGQA